MTGLFRKKEAPPPPPPPPQPQFSPDEVKLCKHCRNIMHKQALQCPSCGLKYKVCKACGQTIWIEESRCPYCNEMDREYKGKWDSEW